MKTIFSAHLTLSVLVMLVLAGCNHLFYYPDDREFLTPEKVELKFERIELQSGSETLHMWKIPAVPSERPGKILHFHGNAQNISTHFLYSAWMARFGYDVYVFDYRGYGRSTGSPDRAGLVEDGVAAIEYAAKVDNKDFFVLAQSLGGAVAVPSIVLSGQSESIRALVLDSTFYSYRTLARDKIGNFWLTWLFQVPMSYMISDDFSPKDYVTRIKMPVLMVHGTDDDVVPFEMGKVLYEMLPGPEKEFWTLEDAPHTWFLGEESDQHIRLLEYLCRRHSRPADCNRDIQSARKKIDTEFEKKESK